MPAHWKKKYLSFEWIEKSAVKAPFEKRTYHESVERKSGLAYGPLGERSPAGDKQLVGILDHMNFLDVRGIVEEIVAVKGPLIESGGIMIVDRTVIEQERRPAQAMEYNAVLSRHSPPGGRADGDQAGRVPFVRRRLAVEPVDGGMDHLPSVDDDRRNGRAAVFARKHAHIPEVSQKRLFTEAQRGSENEFG